MSAFAAVPQFVTVPLPGGTTSQEPTALYQLQEAVQQDLQDYMQFLAGSNSSQYANPAAYTANMIAFAKGLCNYSWSSYTCSGFDPVSQGQAAAQAVFAGLQAIILPSTGKSVYDTWVSGGGPTVISSGPVGGTGQQSQFNPTGIPGVVVPQNPNYVPASMVQSTPIVVVTPPNAVNGVQPTGVMPSLQLTQAGITSAMLLPNGQPNPAYPNNPAYAVLGIPQPSLVPDYITQSVASAGVTSDNLSQSQIAAQGGADVSVQAAPTSANVSVGAGFFSSLGLPQLDSTLFGIPIGFLGIGVLALMMVSSGESGRRGRYA